MRERQISNPFNLVFQTLPTSLRQSRRIIKTQRGLTDFSKSGESAVGKVSAISKQLDNTSAVVAVSSLCIGLNRGVAQTLNFMSTNYGSGAVLGNISPSCVVAADVNGDGKPDLICANGSVNTLTIMTNNGSGIFGSNSVVNVGAAANWVAAADVNGDGSIDLICANNNNPGTLTVLTNNGSGAFAISAKLPTGYNPTFVLAADVNGDGKVDLISADFIASSMTVYTNNGKGVFALEATLSAVAFPCSIAASDINGDGKVDLICANEYAGTVTILTNNGNAGFGSFATNNVGSEPYSVVAADIYGNGRPALITADYGFANGNTLTVLTNNGSGVYGSNTALTVGTAPNFVLATDINGDGKVDLVSVNFQDNTLSVLTTNGFGGFSSNVTLMVGEEPVCVAAADVNGDGKLDLISADHSADLSVQTQIGFSSWQYNVGHEPYFVIATDIENNGVFDLITPNLGNNELTVLTNTGGGIFVSNAAVPVGSGPTFLATGDFNGDGWPDLVCANNDSTTLTILTNNRVGGFGSNQTLVVGSGPTSVAPVDVNGDGKLGLAVTVNGYLLFFANDGNGVFAPGVTLAENNDPKFVVAADVNGDHKPDLICINGLNSKQNDANGTLLVLLNNGSGGFVSNALYEAGPNPRCVAASDINGDGSVDLICANFNSDTLIVLTNNGSGGFVSNATYSVGIAPVFVVASDINGDGWPDLVCANSSDNAFNIGTLTVLTNNRSGGFGFYATISVSGGPTCLAAADLNNDGKPDLVTTTLGGTMTVLLNTIGFSAPPPASLELSVTLSGQDNIVLSWSSSATSVMVQTNSQLTGTNWGTLNSPDRHEQRHEHRRHYAGTGKFVFPPKAVAGEAA